MAVLLASATMTVAAGPAMAVVADVAISGTVASNGTTTLSYRATATRAGTLRYIVVTIPKGSGGRITSANATVRTISPGVLQWRPTKTLGIAVGARFSIPFYGVLLPSGGPWTLSFRATTTAGNVLSAGSATFTRPANVRINATKPIPGQKTTLTYAGTVGRTGILSSVRMKLPTGASGALTSINGTLSISSGYATWRPRSRRTVGAGARLAIPIYGVVLSKYGGVMRLGMTATASTGAQMMAGTGSLALIAPPAPMPTIAAGSFPVRPAGCPSVWPATSVENAKAGTAAWVIPVSLNGPLAAYLTKVSATCGSTVDLKVTSGRPVSVVAYRMGYYQGLGAREIWRRDGVPTVVQPAPTVGGTANGHPLRMASAANWTKTLTIPVTAAWVPGTYLIRVSGGGYASYVPLTVRDDTGRKHALLIQQATTTWQAYNWYGGRSFYSSATTGSGRLTFNRPYAEGQGSGEFLGLEYGLVFWAEASGFDVTYWTDNDLDQFGGQLVARAGTIFLPGHDEYYSLRMRASLSQAIKRGVNVGNFGANAAYRRITFTDSTRRAWDIDRYTAGGSSTLWRYLGDAYASQPLLGAEYVCGVAGNSLTTGRGWLFQGVAAGTVLPGFLAGEVDYVWPGLYKHPGLGIAASGRAICRLDGKSAPMHATVFIAPSGARVFNGSTFTYSCFLLRRCPSNLRIPTPSVASRRAVTTMVTNITNWVGRGTIRTPAGPATVAATAELRAAVPQQRLALDR
ncbi:N,N-dimethylformamidase beta subunit family domain-containing protein [Kribbella sp. NPDC049584]|uniref:N,N-dimethylformamidase beta subunit family domain-containing protein n=1 Tax=Kribbella sp. NPDC049584 TaxID=3154833 RepID=UPI00342546BA